MRLTIAREKKHIKKSAFAKLVGVSAPAVTDWENGEIKMIDGNNLIRVCSVLEITPSWLLDGVEESEDARVVLERDLAKNLDYLTDREKIIITAFRETDDDGRELLESTAENIPKIRLNTKSK